MFLFFFYLSKTEMTKQQHTHTHTTSVGNHGNSHFDREMKNKEKRGEISQQAISVELDLHELESSENVCV